MFKSRIIGVSKYSFKVGGVLGSISGFFGDFLMPIAPFGVYVAFGSVVILLMLLSAHVLIKKETLEAIFDSWKLGAVKEHWFAPTAGALMVLALVSYSAHKVSSTQGEGNGLLATTFPEIGQMQISMGMIQEDLSAIRGSLGSIDSKMDKLKKEISDDPRKELANMGLEWKYTSFVEALGNQDVRSVALYLQGGMKLRDEDLTAYVRRYFSRTTAELLLDRSGIESDAGCPTEHGGFYAGLDGARRTFTKAVCSTTRVLRALRTSAQREKAAIDKVHEYNRTRKAKIAACVNELNATDPEAMYDEAARFNMFSTNTYTVREAVLAELKNDLLLADDISKQRVAAVITRECEHYHREKKVNDEAIKSLETALAVLK